MSGKHITPNELMEISKLLNAERCIKDSSMYAGAILSNRLDRIGEILFD